MRRLRIVAVFVLVSCFAGCKPKLEMSKTVEVAAGEAHFFEVDKIKQEQTIKITGTATGAPVNVFVFLRSNDAKAKSEILNRKSEQYIIQKQLKTEAIDLAAAIPANEDAIVYVESTGKKANVQLTITNR